MSEIGFCYKDHDECCSCFFSQGDLEWAKSLRNFSKVSLDTISKWLETGGKKNAGEKSYKFLEKATCMMFTLRPLPRVKVS